MFFNLGIIILLYAVISAVYVILYYIIARMLKEILCIVLI